MRSLIFKLRNRTNCIIWRKQAVNLANWAKKGALIAVTGRLQTRNYNNQQGQRVYVTEVVAENFQMLESKNKESREKEIKENTEPDFTPTDCS